MKVYLVTKQTDYCGYEVRRTFVNEEYARNYAKMFNLEVEEMEVTETDVVKEHKYHRIEYDLFLAADNKVSVFNIHDYLCEWSEYNSKWASWEITKQRERGALIGKITVYTIDNEKVDHNIVEQAVDEINNFQNSNALFNREPRRVQVGDKDWWHRTGQVEDNVF